MRKIIIAGNWKMNKDAAATDQFCHELADYLEKHTEQKVLPLIAPVYPFLAAARDILAGLPVAIAAQDVSSHEPGAYTGEVSAAQLRSLGLDYCIIGHSERRQYHAESDALILKKLIRLRDKQITPILCIGETLAQRENGDTEKVVLAQLAGCLDQIALVTGTEIVIAYEPVWAIGTGKTATSKQAQEVHALIREWLTTHYGESVSANIHLLYGGSVKPDNIRELLDCPDIDGGLIGGASLKISDFCAMLDIAVDVVSDRAERQLNK